MDRLRHHKDVVPREYPELGLLAWNRDVARAIPAEEAFRLYERNWRHVHKEGMTYKERGLVADLVQQFGHGVMLT